MKSIVLDPDKLAEGWKKYQSSTEQHIVPLQNHLTILDDGIKEHKAQLEKVLDLYISGEFDKSLLLERRERLQATIQDLTSQREKIAAHIENETITQEQILTIQAFIDRVSEGLEGIEEDSDFEAKRRIIEALDVKATLTLENDERIMQLTCRLGQDVLPVSQSTISRFQVFLKMPLIGPHVEAQAHNHH